MTAFGAGAVSLMAAAYALEWRHRAFVPVFALGCFLSSAYGFAIGSVPFGIVEALWGLVAINRHLRRVAYPGAPRRWTAHDDHDDRGTRA